MQDYLAYLKLARSLASAQNLSIKFEDESTAMPRTDGRTLYLPRPNPLWSVKDWSIWNDVCWHEIGHNMPENRDIFSVLKDAKVDTDSPFGAVLNIVDDYRVDKSRTGKYYGMLEAHSIAVHHHAANNGVKMAENAALIASDKGLKIIITMHAFDTGCRADFDSATRGAEVYYEACLDEEAKDWLKTLRDDYTEKYCNIKTGLEELTLVRELFLQVFKEKSEDYGDGKAIGKGSSSEQGSEGSVEGSGADEHDDGGEDGEGKEKKRSKGSTIDYTEWLKHPHKTEFSPSSGNLVRIKYSDDAPAAHYRPHTDETNKIYDYSKGTEPKFSTSGYHTLKENKLAEMVASLNIHTIVSSARRLLQVETRKRPHFNQKRGRLDASKLYRVTIPESSVSERLFKTKDESRALDTAVSVLVDYSGSMSNVTKIGTAAAAGVALNELFRTLRVNCEILGFSELDYRRNATYVFKSFNQPTSDDRLSAAMCHASYGMSNNCDGDNILIAVQRLKAQKQARKVLVVLSDGSPCGGQGDIDGFTKQVIKKIELEREIDILGIGIQDTNVKRLYKNHRVVYNIEELPSRLIETLEDILLERK